MQLTALGRKQLVDDVSFLEYFRGLAPVWRRIRRFGTFSANLFCVGVVRSGSAHTCNESKVSHVCLHLSFKGLWTSKTRKSTLPYDCTE
jgi:hypothetical protein